MIWDNIQISKLKKELENVKRDNARLRGQIDGLEYLLRKSGMVRCFDCRIWGNTKEFHQDSPFDEVIWFCPDCKEKPGSHLK